MGKATKILSSDPEEEELPHTMALNGMIPSQVWALEASSCLGIGDGATQGGEDSRVARHMPPSQENLASLSLALRSGQGQLPHSLDVPSGVVLASPSPPQCTRKV